MALDFYTRADDLCCQRLSSDHLQIALSLNRIGTVYEDKGNFDQALDCWKRALAIYKKNYSDDHLNIARALGNIAVILRQKERV